MKVTNLVEEAVTGFLKENNLSVWNVEFQKEGKDWFLRVYIDREDGEYVSTDDCELASRYISEKLDELDPIEQNYYLEVSSPGMDRELSRPEHFEKCKGEIVDVKCYKAVEGKKEHQGVLVDCDEANLTLSIDEVNNLVIPREQISKVRLAVIF